MGRKKKQVTVTIPSVSLVLLGYSTKTAAERDAVDFQHETVFRYRGTLFPTPGSFNVTPKISDVKVREITGGRMGSKWAIDFTVHAEGARAIEWLSKVTERVNAKNGITL